MIKSVNKKDTSIANTGGVFSNFDFGHSKDIEFRENRIIYILPILFLGILFLRGKKWL